MRFTQSFCAVLANECLGKALREYSCSTPSKCCMFASVLPTLASPPYQSGLRRIISNEKSKAIANVEISTCSSTL